MGTWNVRITNMESSTQWEMKLINYIDILGINKLKLVGTGYFHWEDHTIYYLGLRRNGLLS